MRFLAIIAAALLLQGCGISHYPFKRHHDDPPPQKHPTTDNGPAVERV